MRSTTSLIALSFASAILAIPQGAKESDDGKYYHYTGHHKPVSPRQLYHQPEYNVLTKTLVYLARPRLCASLAGSPIAYSPSIGDHFYTTNVQEMDNAVNALGYQREGSPGRVFPTQVKDTVPLYRVYRRPPVYDHFYTTNEQEMNNAVQMLNYSREGIAGYVYPEAKCGAIPLYRMYNLQITDHFYTSDAAERDNAVNGLGYANEGITGYTLPA